MDETEPGDTGKVKIALNGEFTAPELQDILRELATARAGMQPPVPATVEAMLDMDGELLVEDSATFNITTLANGGLRIYLRSSGFGWLAFNLDASHRARIRDLIADKVTNPRRTH